MLFGFDDPADLTEERARFQPPPSPPASRRPDAWLYVALGIVTGLAIAFAAWALWPTSDSAMTPEEIETVVVEVMAAQTPAAIISGATAYETIAPSLVVVRATGAGEADEVAQSSNGSNLGGGVVINEQGQILTANHVVEGADTIELVFADGTTTAGQLDAKSPALDIAVLSPIGNVALPMPAVLGNSRTLQVGEQIYTVGNPLGLTASLSAGVISGLDRSIPFPGDSDLVLRDLIQFDAAVNQGSSGGPLLNSDGHVIGIVTSLADPAGQGFFIGIGFAVPIDIAAVGAADGPSQ